MYFSYILAFFLQTLTEPAIFAKETSCECRAPHEKLTVEQARLGTPGQFAFSVFSHPPLFYYVIQPRLLPFRMLTEL